MGSELVDADRARDERERGPDPGEKGPLIGKGKR